MACDVAGEPPQFTQRITHAFKDLGMVLHQVLCPKRPASFFVTEYGQNNVAGKRDTFGVGTEQGADHHGDGTFHIQCAASPDIAIGNITGEGWVLPVLLLSCCYVYVTL